MGKRSCLVLWLISNCSMFSRNHILCSYFLFIECCDCLLDYSFQCTKVTHFSSFSIFSCTKRYEGTGRSLSLKLLQQLEEQNHIPSRSVDSSLSGLLTSLLFQNLMNCRVIVTFGDLGSNKIVHCEEKNTAHLSSCDVHHYSYRVIVV